MIYEKLKELLAQYDAREKIINDVHLHDINIEDFQNDLYEYIHKQKLFFKNPAFSSEEEYRFVLRVDNDFSAKKIQQVKILYQ